MANHAPVEEGASTLYKVALHGLTCTCVRSDDIADDAEGLTQHVWPDRAVHVAGASMGGMAAQVRLCSCHC